METTGHNAARAVVPARRLPQHAPALPAPRAILFDLDGTLIDTMPVLADLASEIMSVAYAMEKPLARDMYLATCGLPFFKQLEVICPDDSRNAEVAERFEQAKPARCSRARMAADTRNALVRLQGRGVRVIVSSNNGIDNVESFARKTDFGFDGLLGFGDGMAKGATHVAAVRKRFGFAHEDLLFVGDSLHDGDIADRENLAFVGVAGTFSREQFTLRFGHRYPIVNRPADLPDLFWPPGQA